MVNPLGVRIFTVCFGDRVSIYSLIYCLKSNMILNGALIRLPGTLLEARNYTNIQFGDSNISHNGT